MSVFRPRESPDLTPGDSVYETMPNWPHKMIDYVSAMREKGKNQSSRWRDCSCEQTHIHFEKGDLI